MLGDDELAGEGVGRSALQRGHVDSRLEGSEVQPRHTRRVENDCADHSAGDVSQSYSLSLPDCEGAADGDQVVVRWVRREGEDGQFDAGSLHYVALRRLDMARVGRVGCVR